MMQNSPVKHVSDESALEAFFAPRWTWQSIGGAGVVTLGLFLLLPLLEGWSTTEDRPVVTRAVETVLMSPPDSESVEPLSNAFAVRPRTSAPLPRWQAPPQRLQPVQMTLDLGVVLEPGMGDFAVDFMVSDSMLRGAQDDLVFEIAQLDELPRALAQLRPVYPTQARTRRMEGAVTLDFVVDPDGRTRAIRVVSAEPGDLFVTSAVRAVEGWRFAPGKKDGRAVSARVRQTVVFQLR
ncbi:MAG: energy transducer TonB [Verrucomicrobiota bacterium]|jgi:protein TonB|nr:energy transducer TonB [Verrucomicrobiota bacterium]MDD8050303.1 energy transducer TonB [Verrucomicrobiota bacterium]